MHPESVRVSECCIWLPPILSRPVLGCRLPCRISSRTSASSVRRAAGRQSLARLLSTVLLLSMSLILRLSHIDQLWRSGWQPGSTPDPPLNAFFGVLYGSGSLQTGLPLSGGFRAFLGPFFDGVDCE
jgi:hypothetical protein